jgi:hypothetical protein
VPCYQDFTDQFPEVTPRQFDFAVDRILHRAKTAPCSRHYWQTSLENFFANLAGETDAFLTDLALTLDGEDEADVNAILKEAAVERDLDYDRNVIARVINQANSRLRREAELQSELQLG